jgi:AcrR family transcriptional regulator
MVRDEVARNQRARLYGAMIEAVARRGYAATSVAEVLALAGVSRRAFYELFSNKEDCLLAAYDSVMARARNVMLDAWAGERGWANRLHAGCRAILEDIARSPKPARVVLVESLGAGSSVRERIQLADRSFERLVSLAFSSAPDGPALPRLASQAIVSGVRQLLSGRLQEGREAELLTLTDEILDWCECYRTPAWTRLAASVPSGVRSAGRAETAAFLSGSGSRARALVSILYLALDGGYGDLTDPPVAQFAGISREAFHEQFPSSEEAFLALLDAIAEEALRSVRERVAGVGWPESVTLGMSALVDYLVSHGALARIAFVELFSVGPGIAGRLTRILEEFTRLLVQSGPPPARGPQIAQDAVAGAIWGIVSGRVQNDHVDHLALMKEHLSFLLLAPHVGAVAAVEAIEADRGRRSRG